MRNSSIELGEAVAGDPEFYTPNPRELRVILDAMPQKVWSTRADGMVDFLNKRWVEFTGTLLEDIAGDRWTDLVHPDDRQRAADRWKQSLTTGEAYEIEYRLRHYTGTYRWVLARGMPLRGRRGAIIRWYGTCTDIHELKLAQGQRDLIARELSHRMANIFAVVLSLVQLAGSASGNADIRAFAKSLTMRIAALARAHKFVRKHEPNPEKQDRINLRDLMAEMLAPYEEAEGERITIIIEDRCIGPSAATALALIVHELATNAVKYGALSVPGGAVEIRGVKQGRSFIVSWRESLGPRIAAPPERTGFGTMLSSQTATFQLGATIDHDWREGGLWVTLTILEAALDH